MTNNVALVAGFFVFYDLYQGVFRTAGKALASSFVPDRLQAGALAVQHDRGCIAQTVASIVAGCLWDGIGHGLARSITAPDLRDVGIIALSLLISGTYSPQRQG